MRPTNEAPDYRPGDLDLSLLARQTAQRTDWALRFEQAVESSKRAALQQFAYGLSHEINNPLANISTRAQLLMKDEPDALRRRGMERIVEQAMRAHEMIADLMFYARPPQPVFGEVDPRAMLATVIRDSVEMVRDRGIELRLVEGPPSLRVRADYGMLLEATRALVRNSIEAIAADGRVILSYETVPGDGDPAVADEAADVADQLLIRIADSGPGLSEAASRNALDPYFSGREAGRGLGVGLCRAARIAELHGGRLTLSTGPIGCTASLRIPLGR
jgi:signal transduction histidine kinase